MKTYQKLEADYNYLIERQQELLKEFSNLPNCFYYGFTNYEIIYIENIHNPSQIPIKVYDISAMNIYMEEITLEQLSQLKAYPNGSKLLEMFNLHSEITIDLYQEVPMDYDLGN